MPFKADRPYNDLPPLPPPVEMETHNVLKACVEARAALAEVRIAGQLIPNQAILINLIPILEAQASSEIENIVTTTDRLFRFAKEAANADPATKEALRYRTALRQRTCRPDFRPALLPHLGRCRGRHRATAIRVGVPTRACSDQPSARDEDRPRESVHQPGAFAGADEPVVSEWPRRAGDIRSYWPARSPTGAPSR